MQIGPHDEAVDMVRRCEHVVMVVPVHTQVHVAEYVCEQHGDQWLQGGPGVSVWDFQLQYHDGHGDGDDGIGEDLEAGFVHDRLEKQVIDE